VQWKPHVGVGVDSGTYGIWSPEIASNRLDEGEHRVGKLTAHIRKTAHGDGSFPSLLGLDRKQRPVCFLVGDGLRPEVFAAGRRTSRR